MPIDRNTPTVTAVLAFMRKHRLSAADLIGIGGEDLRSRRAHAKARDVEQCWALIARLEVGYADLEKASPHEFGAEDTTPQGRTRCYSMALR